MITMITSRISLSFNRFQSFVVKTNLINYSLKTRLLCPKYTFFYCFNQRQYYSKTDGYSPKTGLWIATVFVTISSAVVWFNKYVFTAKERQNETTKEFGGEISGLKSYTMKEVMAHNHKSNRIWCSYKSGVYDITEFVDLHPGGDAILMASGGQLEPFWHLYQFHRTDSVLALLEKYRIGNLRLEDREVTETKDDLYVNEPLRHPALIVRSEKPFCAETPNSILVDNYLTPNALFFVRHHLPVPEIDLESYALEISGHGLQSTKTLSLEDIKTKFPKHTITVTIQCAGNRRNELNKIKEVKGLSWENGAIGTAEWSGALLVDVLKYCQLDFDNENIKHVQFEGLDLDVSSNPYGASVTADIALELKNKFLLAYEMNGEEIPLDHGFPIRLIAPGITGARNVKWLKSVILSDEESSSHWQRRDYRSFSPNIDWNNVEWDSAYSIQETPVQSVICDPSDGQKVNIDDKACIKLRGYAFSGGGNKVIRVDVSADGGNNWVTADLKQEQTPRNKTYSWSLWTANIPLSDVRKSGNKIELICRAVDSSYNTQPENAKHIWNFRGVVNNSWHKINVISE